MSELRYIYVFVFVFVFVLYCICICIVQLICNLYYILVCFYLF